MLSLVRTLAWRGSSRVLPEELWKLEQGRDIGPMSDLNYAMASVATCSSLNLAIGKCASAQLSFDFAKPLDGAEV